MTDTSSLTNVNYPWRPAGREHYIQDYDSWQSVQALWNTVDGEGRRLHLLATYVHIASNILNIEQRLRTAWTASRYEHPGIAIKLGEYYKTYTVPTKEDVEAWTERTFHVANCRTAEDFQKQPLDTDPHPHLHWFPESYELLLVCHHTFFDATALWLFWQSFLGLVVRPKQAQFGNEWKNLPLARDDLLGLPRYPSLDANVKGMAILVDALQDNSVQLPTLNFGPGRDPSEVATLASHNEFVRVTISAQETTAIVQNCKYRGVSITATVFAALATACRALQARHGSAGRYAIGFHNFDSRIWFPPRFSMACNAGNDLHTMIPFALDLEAGDFDQVVAAADLKFKSIRGQFSKNHAGVDAISHMLKGLLDVDGPVATFPGFTSFGVGDRLIKSTYVHGQDKVEILDTYHWIHNMVQGMNAVSLHTWKGQMYLGGCFNGAFHSKNMFHQLLQDTFDLVLARVGRSPSHDLQS